MLRETRSTLLSATGGAPAHPTMAGSPREFASRAAIRFLSSPIGTSRMPRRAAHRTAARGRSPNPLPRSSRVNRAPGASPPIASRTPKQSAAVPPNHRLARAMLRSDSPTTAGSVAGWSSSSLPRRRTASDVTGSSERGIPAAIVQQGTALRGLAGDHAPDHDRVVPGLDRVISHAFDVREGAIEQDPGVLPPVITNALEAVVVRIRETAGKGLLMARQDVDHELVCPGDEIVHRRPVVDADRQERRLEGDRGQAVCGHAVGPAIRARQGDHHDPGREPAQQLAELCVVHVDQGHRTIRARNTGLRTWRAGTKSPVTPMKVCAMAPFRPSRSTTRSNSAGHAMA